MLQDPKTNLFNGMFWNPEQRHVFQNARPILTSAPRIYECHVGMSSVEGKVNQYRDFADNVLPRIKAAGYNVV